MILPTSPIEWWLVYKNRLASIIYRMRSKCLLKMALHFGKSCSSLVFFSWHLDVFWHCSFPDLYLCFANSSLFPRSVHILAFASLKQTIGAGFSTSALLFFLKLVFDYQYHLIYIFDNMIYDLFILFQHPVVDDLFIFFSNLSFMTSLFCFSNLSFSYLQSHHAQVLPEEDELAS